MKEQRKTNVRFQVNGITVTHPVERDMRLVDLLRGELLLTGTKEGCGMGECGACTVLVGGRAVNACLVLVSQIDGAEVVTIEGIGEEAMLDPLQESFIEHGAVQCGFCTPGLVLSAKALLDNDQDPTEKDVRTAIAGNLCRCTGYAKVVEAIVGVAGKRK